ncbi:ABC transporter ATP-binding protein [Calditrichota bacterium]
MFAVLGISGIWIIFDGQYQNGNGIIASVNNLVARYDERMILDHVNLEIRRGEILAIIGGSGSGKTTLLKHFIGLLKPYEGTVELFGQDWWELGEVEREETIQQVGVLFQGGALLESRTLASNVALPMEQHTNLPDNVIRRVVRLKLRQVGLRGAEDRMPSELSGGMRKRASLARALVLDPPLLFCDEPSAGLDPPTTIMLDNLLMDLRDSLGLTMVVVTHDTASISRIADRIAFLEKGELVFIGPLQDAFKCEIDSVRQFFEVRKKIEKDY